MWNLDVALCLTHGDKEVKEFEIAMRLIINSENRKPKNYTWIRRTVNSWTGPWLKLTTSGIGEY